MGIKTEKLELTWLMIINDRGKKIRDSTGLWTYSNFMS